MNHSRLKHKPGEDDCSVRAYCTICDLFICSVCGGAEGSLPKDCPGVKMNRAQQDAVSAGRLDYVNGTWVTR